MQPWLSQSGLSVCLSRVGRRRRESHGYRLERRNSKCSFHFALLFWKGRGEGIRYFPVIAHVFLAQLSLSTHACGSSSQMPCQALGQYKHQVCLQYIYVCIYIVKKKIAPSHSKLECVCRDREEARRALVVVAVLC